MLTFMVIIVKLLIILLCRNAKEPAKTLEQIRQELTNIDLENKDQLMSKIELAQATVDQNVDKIISLAEQAAETKSEELWSIVNALNSISSKVNKAEAGRIVALGDKFIANSPENGKAYMTTFL